MPIYEYRCKNCGSRFEKLIGVTEDSSKITCPDCSNAEVEKLLSTFNSGGSVKDSFSAPSACPSCANQGSGSCSL
ncbi:MAG: FmdB family zinc ribbon protein [Elusimicrobiota bacterium]